MDKPIASQDAMKVIDRTNQCIRLLMKDGLPFEAIQKPIDNPEMRRKLIHFWTSYGWPSHNRAREIMGKNFFGIDEAVRYYKVRLSLSEYEALQDIPFTEETLKECKDTHVLVAVFPLSVLDVRKVGSVFFYKSSGGWFESKKFAKSKGRIGWYLVQKTPVADSTSKNWSEQQALLSENEETPTSQMMVYTIIGLYKATGERLFEKSYVRCSDVNSDGNRVFVGYFDSDGLGVGDWWGDDRLSGLGLSSARKF